MKTIISLLEAKIAGSSVPAAMSKIISYIERSLGVKLVKLGVEHFHNSSEEGYGLRFVESGTTNCIRFNWEGNGPKEIVSIDLWNGTSRDPNWNIAVKGVSFAKALPDLVKLLKSPKVGTIRIGAVSESLNSEELNEAKKGEFTPSSAIADMISKLESGRSFNRSEFVMAYHPENAHAFDEWVDANRDKLIFTGKRISVPKGTKLSRSGRSDGSSNAELVVSKGGSHETYEVSEVHRLEDEDHISFADSLEHLEALTSVLIKGSTNALFVAGRGGTGKTQTVEDTLHEHGLSDGSGYFKVTGSASPIGMYTMLYKYRNGIILFDDCDGALDTQDGRNIIKAATDTKKIRKLAWGKKSAGMYDPDEEAEKKAKSRAAANEEDFEGEETDDDDDEDFGTKIPRSFDFKGRVIFISNLPLNKLDPDGALRTRGFIISIDPTPAEMFERMSVILNKVQLEAGHLSPKQRQEVLEVVKTSRRAKDASLRTLVRALNLAASGVPNWEKLCKLYA